MHPSMTTPAHVLGSDQETMSLPLSSLRLLILEPNLREEDTRDQPQSSSARSSTATVQEHSSQGHSPPVVSLLPDLLTALTGVAPPSDPPRESYAGYTAHPPLRVRNRYLDVRVPVWCDEIPLSKGSEGHEPSSTDAATTQSWLTQMLSPEAREVRDAIGALALVLPLPQIFHASISHPWSLKPQFLDLVSAVNRLSRTIEAERSGIYDVDGAEPDHEPTMGPGDTTTILVLQGQLPRSDRTSTGLASSLGGEHGPEMTDEDNLIESVEDQLLEKREVTGWDVVVWDGVKDEISRQLPRYQASASLAQKVEKQRRNIHGELTGLARVHEVLGTGVDWEAAPTRNSPRSVGLAASSTSPDPRPLSPGKEKDALPSSSTVPPQSSSSSFLAPLLDQQHDDRGGDDDDDHRSHDSGADDDTEEVQVEQLGALMQRAMAIREMGGSRAEKERALSALLRGL